MTFKEFVKLSEIGMTPGMPPSPAVNMANNTIKSKAQSLAQNNPAAPVSDVLNQAALQSVTKGNVAPGAALKALNPTQPGTPQQPMMMSKRMKKGMKKR